MLACWNSNYQSVSEIAKTEQQILAVLFAKTDNSQSASFVKQKEMIALNLVHRVMSRSNVFQQIHNHISRYYHQFL